jgi:hypothetical protein
MNRITFYPRKKNKLGFLAGHVQTMFSIMDRYVDYHKASGCIDLPYHFNERATLSILAGAIWRGDENSLVLEEYRTDKRSTEGNYKGRRDVWFHVSGHTCYGEAKQLWIPLYRPRNDLNQLLAVLEQETNSAQQALPDVPNAERPEFGLGILFVTPSILKAHIAIAQVNLTKHHKALAEGLCLWCERKGYHVLWARYVRADLLQESGCYEWSNGQIGTCPSLDTLICTP